MGRQTNINSQIENISTSLLQPQNNIDLIFGKDGGTMSTGFGIHYAGSSDEDNTGAKNLEAKALALSAGFKKENKEGYARLDLIHDSKDNITGTKYDGDMEFEVGGTLELSESSLTYIEFEWTKFDHVTTSTSEHNNKNVSLGYVKYIELKREDNSSGTAIKTENIHSTVVAAGASLNFSDFVLDGVFKGSTGTGEFDADDLLS